MSSSDELKAKLSHVLWIGGSTCAGKSSVGDVLSSTYGLQVYHYDRHEPNHISRMDRETHPAIAAFMSMTMDERWVLRDPEEMARETIRAWTERFGLVMEDLLSMPEEEVILAEGVGLFPDCVAPLISNPRQAVCLVSAPKFLAAMRYKRGMTAPEQTSDPDKARRNIIARDLLIARYVRQRAEEHGLSLIQVDDSRPIEDTVASVERHFGPLLVSHSWR